MDWSKAKTIIIVAFIITNILLGYMIVGQKSVKDPTLTDNFIEKSKDLLEDSEIYLATDIPKTIPKLNTITVNYEELDLDGVNKKFLDNEADIELLEASTILEHGDEKVTIEGKKLSYMNAKEDGIHMKLDRDKVLRLSKDFLLAKEYSTDDLKLVYIEEKDGVYTLEYSKVYKGLYVENTYSRFEIDKGGIRKFERLWLDVKDEGEKEIYIDTAPKAVLALLGREEYKGRKIVDISLCYYFNSKMEDVLDEPVESIEGRAVPAWRIEFDDGSKFIVDEY